MTSPYAILDDPVEFWQLRGGGRIRTPGGREHGNTRAVLEFSDFRFSSVFPVSQGDAKFTIGPRLVRMKSGSIPK